VKKIIVAVLVVALVVMSGACGRGNESADKPVENTVTDLAPEKDPVEDTTAIEDTRLTPAQIGEVIFSYPSDWEEREIESTSTSQRYFYFGAEKKSFLMAYAQDIDALNEPDGLQLLIRAMLASETFTNPSEIRVVKFSNVHAFEGLEYSYFASYDDLLVELHGVVSVYDHKAYGLMFALLSNDVNVFDEAVKGVTDSISTADGEANPLIGELDPAFDYFSDEEFDDEEEDLDEDEAAEEEPSVPTEYLNALEKAGAYSDMNMSKKGIYDQLTSEYGEGFPEDAAQYAIDNLDADYKANALAKAKVYFEDMSMSKNAVYDQLISEYGEQFTKEEAQYAIDHLE
jgi:hypothetical protein